MIVDRSYSSITIKNGNFTNVKMRGLATSTIDKISGFDKDRLRIEFSAPKLSFNGYFKADVSAFIIPIRTEGDFTLNLCKY